MKAINGGANHRSSLCLDQRDHFVSQGGFSCCVDPIKGNPQSEKDGVYRGIKDPKAKEAVSIDFAPMKNSKIGELTANFNIVLGLTPEA